MADNAPGDAPEQDLDQPQFPALPPREAIPPLPDVAYQRPSSTPGQPAGKYPSGKYTSGENGSGASGHGAGIAAGTTFVAGIVGGALVGNFIDSRWDHTGTPWATLVLTLLGAVSGFINMQRILSRSDRNNKS